MTQHPYLNLGAGRIILPGERPFHHALVDPAIYNYPLWHNVDRNKQSGIDECADVFTYPWPWADNSYDGALLSHLVEHIPHEVKIDRRVIAGHSDEVRPGYDRREALLPMQDGWYAFFAELYRVLTDGAVAHILSPYGWSQGAITDPTHTRLLSEHTFTHSMAPDPNSPFEYQTGGIHFEMTQPAVFHMTEMFQHLKDDPVELTRALQTRINVAYEFYVKLRVVK